MATVLIVDDEPSITQALRTFFERSGGHVVMVAHSGADALAMFERARPDIVLLDVRLPDIAGPEVYAQLRARQPAQAERVIFVTGGLWRSESRLRLELPPQPVLSKPCGGAQLREALQALAVRPAA